MLYTIVIHEILDHLRSLRFMMTSLVLILLMMVSAALFLPNYRQQEKDFAQNMHDTMSVLTKRALEEGALKNIFGNDYTGPGIYSPPNHLSFISEGHGEELPNAFRPSAFKIFGPEKYGRSNPLLWKGDALDWALIIGTIMSFMALVLVYDRISGERENGTLRLHLSNSVPRSMVIMGKFLGGFACIAPALLIGMIINLLILLVIGRIPFETMDGIIIGLTFILSLLYITAFLMLGLLISSLTRHSATSLIISLLVWALMVVVIPGTSAYLSSKRTPIPAWLTMVKAAEQAEYDAEKNYYVRNGQEMHGYDEDWYPGASLEMGMIVADAWSKIMDDYRNRMIEQVERARGVTLVSPYSCFTCCLESLGESGIVSYKHFFQQVRDYRIVMRQRLLDLYPLPVKWSSNHRRPTSEYEARYKKMMEPLNFSAVPKFVEKRSSPLERCSEALPFILLIVMFDMLFFVGAFVSFLRYDVR